MTEQSDSKEKMDLVSFVISSHYRLGTVECLLDGPSTPSGIADDADMEITHTSRALQELREEGIVDLIVSEDRKKGRIYALEKPAVATRAMELGD